MIINIQRMQMGVGVCNANWFIDNGVKVLKIGDFESD